MTGGSSGRFAPDRQQTIGENPVPGFGMAAGIRCKFEVYKDSDRNRSGRWGRIGTFVCRIQNCLGGFCPLTIQAARQAARRIGPGRPRRRPFVAPACIHDATPRGSIRHAA